jgi:hypothetical protein
MDRHEFVLRNEKTSPKAIWDLAVDSLRETASRARPTRAAWASALPALLDLYRVGRTIGVDPFDLVIVDEVHNWIHGKNAAEIARFGIMTRAHRALLLTATPLQLSPTNLPTVFSRFDRLASRIPRTSVQLPGSEVVDALEQSDRASDRFRRVWSATSEAVSARPDGAPDLEPDHPFALSFLGLETANRALERTLRPWFIRHRLPRAYRLVLVGDEFTIGSIREPIACRPDQHLLHPAPGFESERAEVAQLALMRLASIATEGLAKSPLAMSMTGCFTTPFQSREVTAFLGRKDTGPYEAILRWHQAGELPPSGGRVKRRPRHPKLERLLEFVDEQWAQGEKIVIYCNRVPTAEIVHALISEQLDTSVESTWRSSADALRRRYSYALLDRIVQSIVLAENLEVDYQDLARRSALEIQRRLEGETVQVERAHRVAQQVLAQRLLGLVQVPETARSLLSELADGPASELRGTFPSSSREIEAVVDDVLYQPNLLTGEVHRTTPQSARLARALWCYTMRHNVNERHELITALGLLLRSKVTLDHLLDERLPNESVLEQLLRRLQQPYGRRTGQQAHTESLVERFALFVKQLSDLADLNRKELLAEIKSERTALTVELLTGRTGKKQRARVLQAFNTPLSPDVLVCTEIAGEGIDLHRFCRIVIHYDLDFNPAKVEQRTGRCDRIDSRRQREGNELVVGLPLLAGSYDERIYERLLQRDQTNEALLGGDLSGADVASESTDDDISVIDGTPQLIPLPDRLLDRLRPTFHVWEGKDEIARRQEVVLA